MLQLPEEKVDEEEEEVKEWEMVKNLSFLHT